MKTWIAVVAVVAHIFCLTGTGWAQPFTRIVSPVQNQCVPGPDVTIKFEAGGMTLGASAWNLHFMLDAEPFQIQYDGNHAHVFKNVLPGTHTVRVYAANAMHEAIPGTQSTVSFSVAYPDKANYVMPGTPTLTYNLPQGEYFGIDAADVTVDFLLENVTLSPGGYQVAYYADGRRFIVQDGCGPRHLKNLNPGLHRIRIELQDQFGDLVPGPFNSTERVILISPDRVTKTASPIDDGYDGLPRLNSIKGSMTMGQHWSATEPIRPLSPVDIRKQLSLTVRDTDGNLIDKRERDGLLLSPENGAERVDVTKSPREGFTVRPGGEPEAGTVDLDVANTDNVRRGTVIINNEDADADEDEVDGEETVESTTKAAVVKNGAAANSQAESATRTLTRRRADGTTTTVRQTTATQRLEDRPGLRTAEKQTSRTIYPSADKTTATAAQKTTATQVKSDNSKTTRGRDRSTSRSKRAAGGNDRKTTAPPAPTLD